MAMLMAMLARCRVARTSIRTVLRAADGAVVELSGRRARGRLGLKPSDLR
ncbi:MAG TPA: hypothetical protein VGR57_06240 [Ktedonobacterales bacterium]|nr:hypothetical protein [Ktedonobacterales bacterium]